MPNSDTSRFWIAAEVFLGLALVALPASLGGAPEWTSWLLLGLVALAERALLPWHVSMARDRGAH